MSESARVTQILKSLDEGDVDAAGQLLPLVYEELRRLAASIGDESRSRLID